MNELKIFENETFGAVRVVEIDGEPWFVAKDVLRALGYAEEYNPSRAMQAIPEEWKGVHRMHTRSENGVEQEREMLTISEQGLYFFLGRSDKEAALPFQKWAAGEVFPTLRQKGFVGTPPALSSEEILSRALEIIGKKNTELERRILADAPKVEFAEAVSDAEGGMTVNQFAKVLRQRGIRHMGPHNLFHDLRKHGFLMRQRKHWNVPRQKYIEKGWFKITVHLSPEDDGIQYETTDFAITGQGQLGLLAFFMDKYGISRQLPLLEGGRRNAAIFTPHGRKRLQ